MNREEALQEYSSTLADELVGETKKKLYEELKNGKDVFANKLIDGFAKLADKVVESKEEITIGYIQISYLQTGIVDGSYEWYMEAQDKRGSLDMADRNIVFSMKEFFLPLEELREKLLKASYAYNGAVTEFDIEMILVKTFRYFVPMFYYLGCYAFQDIKESDGYQKLTKESLFRVILGEYKGISQILHITNDEIVKDEEYWKRLFSAVEENGFTNKEFQYQDFGAIRFREEMMAYKSFQYSSFKGSVFEEHRVVACNLLGANLQNIKMKDCYFHFNVCVDADFRGAQITDTAMWSCRFEDGKMLEDLITPGVGGVRFDGAVLTRVDLSHSSLVGAHFEKATLEDVVWTNCDLTGAVFSKEVESTLQLTKEQRNVVRFV